MRRAGSAQELRNAHTILHTAQIRKQPPSGSSRRAVAARSVKSMTLRLFRQLFHFVERFFELSDDGFDWLRGAHVYARAFE